MWSWSFNMKMPPSSDKTNTAAKSMLILFSGNHLPEVSTSWSSSKLFPEQLGVVSFHSCTDRIWNPWQRPVKTAVYWRLAWWMGKISKLKCERASCRWTLVITLTLQRSESIKVCNKLFVVLRLKIPCSPKGIFLHKPQLLKRLL